MKTTSIYIYIYILTEHEILFSHTKNEMICNGWTRGHYVKISQAQKEKYHMLSFRYGTYKIVILQKLKIKCWWD